MARILRVANRVEHHLSTPGQSLKDLRDATLVPEKHEGERIRIVTLPSTEEEARWVSSEIERLHRAGARWRSMAVLYRMHTHRERLVEELKRRGIPFVIRNLSILNHRLVRDVLAYLRLIANERDDVACARALAAPAWGLAPEELARLAERAARSRGSSIWETLQAAQGELFAAASGRASAGGFVALVTDLRKRARRIPAIELIDELLGQLEVGVVAGADDRKYVARLRNFVAEWQQKSETGKLQELAEYLDYFEQANGQINLEEESGDAVQLMTVHAAKGLEFDRVFVLRLVNGGFPARERPRVLEFPAALMKESLPAGDFHIQEERRLFYVALTRARDLLTLTTVVHKRSKPSPFLDDILMDPALQRRDLQQLAPERTAESPAAEPPTTETLFGEERASARAYSRIAEWAESYRPPVTEPLQLSASAIETFNFCPQKYLFGQSWKIRTGPRAAMSFGNVMHTTIKEFIGQLRKGRTLSFDEVAEIYNREWTSAGYEDSYQEEEYKKDGLEQLRAFHSSALDNPPDVIAQERQFDLPLENNVVLSGRIDQVNRIGERAVEIVDYKTGKPKIERQAKSDLQLGVYALAARELLDWDPVRLIFYNLQNNETIATARDAKQLAAVQDVAQETAAEIRAGQFPPKKGYACKNCDFRLLCPAHEQGAAAATPGEE